MCAHFLEHTHCWCHRRFLSSKPRFRVGIFDAGSYACAYVTQMPRQWQYQQYLCFFVGAPVVFLVQIIYICIYVFRLLEMLVLVYISVPCCHPLSLLNFALRMWMQNYVYRIDTCMLLDLHLSLSISIPYLQACRDRRLVALRLILLDGQADLAGETAQWRGESKQLDWHFDGFLDSLPPAAAAKVSLQWAWATLRCSCFVPRKWFFLGGGEGDIAGSWHLFRSGQILNRYFGYLTDKHACCFRWNDRCLSIPVVYHASNRVLLTFIPLLRSSRLRSS